MPNPAEAMVRESIPLKDWRDQQPTLEQGALWLFTRATDYPKGRALELLAEALKDERRHAAQQVQATWEEAIKEVEQNHEYHQIMHGRCKCLMVANRLRRRAQEAKG